MAKVAKACFSTYYKARVDFAVEVAELASKAYQVDTLRSEGVLVLLRPLLTDPTPAVQQPAALAVGRLAEHSAELAEEVVAAGILPQVVAAMAPEARTFLAQAAGILRSVGGHSAQLGACVVEAGAVPPLVECLKTFDVAVKEAAAGALGALASHNGELASAVIDAGAVPLLVLCAQEPEPGVKRAAAAAIAEAAKHSRQHGGAVVNAGALPPLVALVRHGDARVRRAACGALGQIAKHDVGLGEAVTEAGLFPRALGALGDADVLVRKAAAVAVREVVQHSAELAGMAEAARIVPALVQHIVDSRAAERSGAARLPAVVALGFIASFSAPLSSAVVAAGGVGALKGVMIEEPEDHVKAAAAWALGQVGHHAAAHAGALADGDVLRHLLALAVAEDSSDDLRTKAKRALKASLGQCMSLPAMQPLLRESPLPILKVILGQFKKVLSADQSARRSFVQTGGLQLVQQIPATDAAVAELVDAINSNFPPEVVQYCSPGFSATLADRVHAEMKATA